MAHTPGPWRTSGAALDGFAPIMAPGGVIVALVSTLSANVKADAMLIAAAPDMLKALVDLVNSFEKHRSKDLWDAARAAIAKASL